MHQNRKGVIAATLLLATMIAVCACDQNPSIQRHQAPPPTSGRQTVPQTTGRDASPPRVSPPDAVRFTDITKASGLQFTHSSGASGRGYYVEQFGSGAAFFDYDSDGFLDVFLAGGGRLPGYTGPAPTGNKLYRGNGRGAFVDVTRSAGLETSQHTLGVAVGDYDNDGHADIYLTTLQGNMLYHNDGQGHFVNVTVRAGVSVPAMSAGAAFLDYDNDGLLDLFVLRYTDYSLSEDRGCKFPSMGAPVSQPAAGRSGTGEITLPCGPTDYPPTANRLFHNDGNGTFTNVTAKSGVGLAKAHGLGIAVGDYNEDGRQDIFVASDRFPNLLFINGGDGTFKERARKGGINVYSHGLALGGMGADVGDYDNDGHADLIITNYESEPSTLYRGRGDGSFADASVSSSVMALSKPFVKWGVRFLDLDGNGFKDLFVVNGHVDPRGTIRRPVIPDFLQQMKGFAQEAQLYLSEDRGARFVDASSSAGPFFSEAHVARGAAFGDFDNDGDWDALVVSVNEPATLLRNDTPRFRWARIALEGDRCNRDALGARLKVTNGGATPLVQTEYVRSAGSYLSDHDRRPLFALPRPGAATVQIRWPCGAIQTVELAPGQTTSVKEVGCLLRTGGDHLPQER